MCSLDLVSTFGRNESFGDGVGLEIEGGVPTDLKDLMFFKIPKAWGLQFLHFSLGDL